jgi:hypothetical protein
MNRSAKMYACAVIAAGTAVLAVTLNQWSSQAPLVWLVYLGIVVLTSMVKLSLPHISGTYSLNSLVVLYGLARFSPAEMIAAGCLAAAAQTLFNSRKKPAAIQVLFNMANMSLSLTACFLLKGALLAMGLGSNPAAMMSAVACVYFVVNTLLVSGVLALLQNRSLSETRREWYLWSLPYYLVGAALVGLTLHSRVPGSGEAWLVLVPLVYLVHFFFGLTEMRSTQKKTTGNHTGTALPKMAWMYLMLVISAGGCLLWASLVHWKTQDPLRFAVYLFLALAASTLKVKLPGMTGTLSPNFVLLLVALAQLSLPETVVIAMSAAAVQSLWRPKHWPKPEQVLFNSAGISLSAALAFVVCNQLMAGLMVHSFAGWVTLATLILYSANTLLVAAILCLIESKPLHHSWKRCHFWSFPYYLAGAAVAGLMTATASPSEWLVALPMLSLMTLVYVSYRTHVAQVVR